MNRDLPTRVVAILKCRPGKLLESSFGEFFLIPLSAPPLRSIPFYRILASKKNRSVGQIKTAEIEVYPRDLRSMCGARNR